MSVGAIAVGGVFLLAGLALVWRSVRYYRIGTLVLDTPTEKVRSASIGRTELRGTAVPAEYVIDRPFSEGQCLYADYRVRQRVYHERPVKAYATIFEHTVAVHFYLDDGTGRVRVDADGNTRVSLSDANARTHGSKNPYIFEFLRENTGLTGTVQDLLPGDEAFDPEAVARARRQQLVRLERQYGSFEHVPRPALNDSTALGADSGWSVPTLKQTVRWLWRVIHFTPKRSGDVSDSMTHRRFGEAVLPIEASVYVFGGAKTPPADADIDLMLTEDPTTEELLVSDRPAAATGNSFRRWSYAFLELGLSAMALGLWVVLNSQ